MPLHIGKFKHKHCIIYNVALNLDPRPSEVLASLMECALKMEVSMPTLDRMVLIHLAMVALDAGPCGFVDDRKLWPPQLNQSHLSYMFFPRSLVT